MFLGHVIIVVCFLKYIYCGTDLLENEEVQIKKKELEDELDDIQHKTPLIDIIFTDGSKRTCTGAIIHEYIVITAGHCFKPKGHGRLRPRDVEAELTGSFVVTGTKKKFDSGYEQYLPIERVITHPDMDGWSCDLALVHTFASMTADQIGSIMSLAGEKTSTSIEPNVTILSWGRVTKYDIEEVSSNPCCSDDKLCDSIEQAKCSKTPQDEPHTHEPITHNHKLVTAESEIVEAKSTVLYDHKNEHRFKLLRKEYPIRKREFIEITTKVGSRYLSSREATKHHHDERRSQSPAEDGDEEVVDPANRRFIYEGQAHMRAKPSASTQLLKFIEYKILCSYYVYLNKDYEIQPKKNPHPKPAPWRRQIGAKETNKLTIETFGFLNAASCKKMLEHAQPNLNIRGDEFVCYASDDHYVTEEDSGAPVVRLGQLIAITVGGIRSDGEHVAVGMRLSHFCPWINENLPAGDVSLNCWAHHHTTHNETDVMEEIKRSKISGGV